MDFANLDWQKTAKSGLLATTTWLCSPVWRNNHCHHLDGKYSQLPRAIFYCAFVALGFIRITAAQVDNQTL